MKAIALECFIFAVVAVYYSNAAPVDAHRNNATHSSPAAVVAHASADVSKRAHIDPYSTIKSYIHPHHKLRRHHRRRRKHHRRHHRNRLRYPIKSKSQFFGNGRNVTVPGGGEHGDFEALNGEIFEHGAMPDLNLRKRLQPLGFGPYGAHNIQRSEKTYEDGEAADFYQQMQGKDEQQLADFQRTTNTEDQEQGITLKGDQAEAAYREIANSKEIKSNDAAQKAALSNVKQMVDRNSQPQNGGSMSDPRYAYEGFGYIVPQEMVDHAVGAKDDLLPKKVNPNTVFMGRQKTKYGHPDILGSRLFDNDGHILSPDYTKQGIMHEKSHPDGDSDENSVLLAQGMHQSFYARLPSRGSMANRNSKFAPNDHGGDNGVMNGGESKEGNLEDNYGDDNPQDNSDGDDSHDDDNDDDDDDDSPTEKGINENRENEDNSDSGHRRIPSSTISENDATYGIKHQNRHNPYSNIDCSNGNKRRLTAPSKCFQEEHGGNVNIEIPSQKTIATRVPVTYGMQRESLEKATNYQAAGESLPQMLGGSEQSQLPIMPQTGLQDVSDVLGDSQPPLPPSWPASLQGLQISQPPNGNELGIAQPPLENQLGGMQPPIL